MTETSQQIADRLAAAAKKSEIAADDAAFLDFCRRTGVPAMSGNGSTLLVVLILALGVALGFSALGDGIMTKEQRALRELHVACLEGGGSWSHSRCKGEDK